VDFTKAFDRVNHNIVINKLIQLGVRRSIIPTVCSFLTDRTQNTKLHGVVSTTRDISCGVPQGTKLGPILFLVLVNDASVGGCRRWKYVDDLTLGEVVKYDQQSSIQDHLDNLSTWCKSNDVLPKPEKCCTMTISFLKRDVPQTSVSLNSINLRCATSIKLLGVTVQNNLKWDIHIAEVVSKASRRLYTLCVLRKSKVPTTDMVAVYTCYIRPVLEYASQVWHSSITERQVIAVENVQKRAARIIFGLQYQSYTMALELLGISSLKSRREDLFIKFGKNLLGSSKFRNMLPPEKTTTRDRVLRPSTVTGLHIPKCRTERYKRSTIPALARIL
jgi:hypothetical protein